MTKEELFLKATKGKLCTDEKNYIPTKKKETVTPVNPNKRFVKVGNKK